jgi:hypothetical protein
LSHRISCGLIEAEVAEFLQGKVDNNGQISVMDMWEARSLPLTSTKQWEQQSFASYNEILHSFLRERRRYD